MYIKASDGHMLISSPKEYEDRLQGQGQEDLQDTRICVFIFVCYENSPYQPPAGLFRVFLHAGFIPSRNRLHTRWYEFMFGDIRIYLILEIYSKGQM
ncbi:hypothetical protein POX_e06205 [Penicillium oxalicum]|uniref:hypothetical protein n=1 Tax=Penicillium oxalicum TaxID=69781 RepID=UPI0020B70A45|nr:hypothetical protein POX_e06205 [Penicillium oxalicum]KAI2788192.1 hypothetical protein POX_e06205 [Penicillium oxalicum]